ncbi:MAG TPA: N-acyl homoserine lactonase family protein [Myxococcota bacterium]|nr:N-acyl homoserine lactonase family protein [Myxococcota bacterium]
MKLHPLSCGWLTGALGGFLEGETGELRVPVLAWLVEHPKGTLVFDAGMHPAVADDPKARLGFMADFFRVELGRDETVGARLRERGVDPGRVDLLVNSHLHFDHAGGNAELPNARLVVQRREWEAGADPDLARRNAFLREDYDLGHDLDLVDGEHDVFGDGRVTCIPTHGHTPGHQSLRVRLDSGEVVLSADACYLRQTLEDLHLPGVVYDREAMLASLRRLRALRDAGAKIWFGHDPEQWETLPRVIE